MPLKLTLGHSFYTAVSPFCLQFFKEEEELSSQMSSFNEAMTQIRELEERAMEELREIIQVQTGPSQGGIGRPLLHSPQSSTLFWEHHLGFAPVLSLGWDNAAMNTWLCSPGTLLCPVLLTRDAGDIMFIK